MFRLIKTTLRLGIRLGLVAGIGFALFKLVKGRRAEYGSPSADWAPTPAPNPNLPKQVPEPELITPVELTEIIAKKAAEKAGAEPVAVETAPAPPVAEPVADVVALLGESAVKKNPPPAKKAAEPAAVGPVKKVAPKKAAATPKPAPAAEKAPVAPKKAAPSKKATKKPE